MTSIEPEFRPNIEDILEELKLLTSFKKLKKDINKFENLNEFQMEMIENDNFRQFLKEYLRTEYSTENILFFEDVKIFSKMSTDQERFLKAEEICQSYIYETSPLEINVSGKFKNFLFNELEDSKISGEIDVTLFDEMTKHVSDTIMLDTFPRFEKSKLFGEFKDWSQKYEI